MLGDGKYMQDQGGVGPGDRFRIVDFLKLILTVFWVLFFSFL